MGRATQPPPKPSSKHTKELESSSSQPKRKGKLTAKEKGKSKVVEKPPLKRLSSTRVIQPRGGIHIRSSPPSSPRGTQALALAPPGRTPYPFGTPPQFENSKHRERYDKFKNFEVLPTLYPDDDLSKHEFYDEFEDIMCRCGFGFMFKDDPGTYPELVREFLSSLEAEWVEKGRDPKAEGKVYRYVGNWSFRMGGKDFSIDHGKLDKLLGNGCYGVVPHSDEEGRNKLWRVMSGKDEDFTAATPATMISNPMWKLIHRFIASSIHARKDKGKINLNDMDLMSFIYKKKPVDVVSVLTSQFEEYGTPSNKSKGLGGGSVITMLATHFGFTLDPKYALKKERLSKAKLVYMRMLDPHGAEWKSRSELPPKLKKSGTKKPVEKEATTTHEPVPPARDYQPSPEVPTFDPSSVGLEELARFTHEFSNWQGRMMGIMFEKMGWSGYEPPPQFRGRVVPTPNLNGEPPVESGDDQEGEENEGIEGEESENDDENEEEDGSDEDATASSSDGTEYRVHVNREKRSKSIEDRNST